MKINKCSVCGKKRPLGIDARCQDCLDDCLENEEVLDELDESENTEFEELETENRKLRNNISKLIGVEKHKEIWIKINELVENELQQEELCE